MRAVLLVAGLASACLLLTAPVQATHPRPKGATPFRVPLVPVYNSCSAPNRTHGPPLAFPSCNPPRQASSYLTVGTPDANGAPANSAGFFRLTVDPSNPVTNIVTNAELTDVRCNSAALRPCGNSNTAGGPDYVGELQAQMTVRLTDHDNAPAPGGGTEAATVVDIPNPVTFTCAATADPSIGGACKFTQGMCPVDGCSSVEDGDRTVAALSQVRVMDGGPDGQVLSADNTVFAAQALFVP
jgi:hypothetical protein